MTRCVLLILALAVAACDHAPRTAQEVVDRSIQAHGGAGLSTWRTLSIRGHVEMQDGIRYKAAYLLLAQSPGKLRVEQDMTADRGRLFYEHFMNGPNIWSRSNLVVGSGNAKQVRRWYRQASGIAQVTAGEASRGPAKLVLKPEAVVEWKERAGPTAWRTTESRPAYVVSYTVDGEAIDLYVDKQSFFLVQESWPGGRRLYKDFKRFGTVLYPTRVLEIVTGRQGEVLTPYTFESVAFDQPIEDWLFSEDMPVRGAAGAGRAQAQGTGIQ
jgi:hypothetical protein